MKYIQFFLIIAFINSCDNRINNPIEITEGVSKELALYRKNQVSEVKYQLFFNIPKDIDKPIPSKLKLEVTIHDLSQPLVLDFMSNRSIPKHSITNGNNTLLSYEKEHLIVPTQDLILGKNNIEIDFIAGEMSLNRNEDYMFTLLVPDRARTLFPCFDQPDIKATYTLNVSAPKEWKVLCGSPIKSSKSEGDKIEYQFNESDKMSTYLFSFVVGKFDEASSTRSKMSLFYQEKDSSKIQLSIPRIFKLHQQSIDYLEKYTQFNFPFQKLDYATIFSHPYGGMEHTGAIQYDQSNLFLDNSASENQKLRRAKLIAHETSHMWFGNLVTMKWFDDVWLKEVFANFMVDKIINPEFESINHDLSFFVYNHPTAYMVDRTKGAHPIRQKLNNLNNAGSIYGNIIYHKAPIMMQQLEAIVGEVHFQEGIVDYISTYANNNADWNDLIHILDQKTPLDLKDWSKVWVNSPGRPVITSNIQYNNKTIKSFEIKQHAEDKSGHIWPQVFDISLVYPDSVHVVNVSLKTKKIELKAAKGLAKPQAILYNSNGMGYGVFPITTKALDIIPRIKDEVARAALYQNCFENTLKGNISLHKAYNFFLEGLQVETNELILRLLSNHLKQLFWSFISEEERLEIQQQTAKPIFNRLLQLEKSGIKKTLFNTYLSIGYTANTREKLYKIWRKELLIDSLKLNQDEFTSIGMKLALFNHPKTSQILKTTRATLKDPNKIKRFDFLLPALSINENDRNDYFLSFTKKKNRKKEIWVLAACGYIHHPLRQESAIKTLHTSLDLLEEIQQTGDIFFPKRWLDYTIGQYASPEALQILEHFIKSTPDLNPQLKLKVLQAADNLYRANQLRLPLEKQNP